MQIMRLLMHQKEANTLYWYKVEQYIQKCERWIKWVNESILLNIENGQPIVIINYYFGKDGSKPYLISWGKTIDVIDEDKYIVQNILAIIERECRNNGYMTKRSYQELKIYIVE